MRLVELLAKELKEWPDNELLMCATQELDGEIWFASEDVKFMDGTWHSKEGEYGSTLAMADDWEESIVTRAKWEAARAKLKPKKASADGWVRNRGGRCPVQSGTLIDLKLRGGVIHIGKFCDNYAWIHTGQPFDVMYYRLSKPADLTADEKVMQDCVEKCASAESADELLYDPIAQGPLQWRDRITELDAQRAKIDELYQRQSAEIEQERDLLIAKLTDEGFALIDRVNAQIAECAHKHEDMSDWQNWKAGDVLMCEGAQTSHYTNGKLYSFIRFSEYGSARAVDDRGIENGLAHQFFKWHSRPTK